MEDGTPMPCFQKGHPTDTSNYRPISLLSVPSKILESCVADTLVEHVMDNGLLTDKQYGLTARTTRPNYCWFTSRNVGGKPLTEI